MRQASIIGSALQQRGKTYDSSGSIAERNRHTGQPHEHRREIARRARQASRL